LSAEGRNPEDPGSISPLEVPTAYGSRRKKEREGVTLTCGAWMTATKRRGAGSLERERKGDTLLGWPTALGRLRVWADGRGKGKGARLASSWVREEKRSGPSGQNRGRERFSFSFVFLFQKVFKTHFKILFKSF